MEFTRYIWELYTASDCGRAAIAKPAEAFAGSTDGEADALFRFRVQTLRDAPDGDLIPIEGEFGETDVRLDVRTYFSDRVVNDAESARLLFTELVDEGLTMSFEEDGETRFYGFGGKELEADVFSNIEAFSLGLYGMFPEYFVPFLFRTRFDQFTAICRGFNIPIPPPPGKTQRRDRALYYLALNEALQEFRRRHQLTPPELVAFLYDFAPRVSAAEQDSELPSPSRVWFTMGGINDNGDFDLLDQADQNSTSRWQGNVETRRGDVILMWCVSPRSCLHSIWRALDDGFADPFFYFYNSMRIGRCIKVPPVCFKESLDDPVLSSNKSVRAHFQGAGGKSFPLEDYLVLLEMLKSKGCETSVLPVPPPHAFAFGERLENERDVEIQLVEPLLNQLGYSVGEWLRQMPLRMGRGERNYPDYAVEPNPKRGEESATFLIETKYEISTKQQIEEAYIQGKSYALRLQAMAFVLAAKEGLWLYRQADGFSAERHLHWTWQDIEHPDRFHEVAAELGKGRLTSRRRRARSVTQRGNTERSPSESADEHTVEGTMRHRSEDRLA